MKPVIMGTLEEKLRSGEGAWELGKKVKGLKSITGS